MGRSTGSSSLGLGELSRRTRRQGVGTADKHGSTEARERENAHWAWRYDGQAASSGGVPPRLCPHEIIDCILVRMRTGIWKHRAISSLLCGSASASPVPHHASQAISSAARALRPIYVDAWVRQIVIWPCIHRADTCATVLLASWVSHFRPLKPTPSTRSGNTGYLEPLEGSNPEGANPATTLVLGSGRCTLPKLLPTLSDQC